jgi:hypothetical protein
VILLSSTFDTHLKRAPSAQDVASRCQAESSHLLIDHHPALAKGNDQLVVPLMGAHRSPHRCPDSRLAPTSFGAGVIAAIREIPRERGVA